MTPTMVSFFAGIEGFGLGFEHAGFECVMQIETDKYCRQVLRRHFPNADRSITDVRDATADNVPRADVFTGGFPCQNLSVAGRREGLDGDRSGLWYEFHRVIASVRPRWVVIENVPGLLNSHEGRDFAVLLGGLTGIIPNVPDDGWGNGGVAKGPIYNVAYRVLDAQFFGVPQRRRRVFIVGCLGDAAGAAEVLFEPESCVGHPAPSREAGAGAAFSVIKGAAIGRKPEAGPQWGEHLDDGSAYTLNTTERHAVAYSGGNTSGPIDRSTALNTKDRIDFDTETFIAHSVAMRGRDGGATAELGDDIANALRSSQGGGDKPYVLAQNGSDIQVSNKLGTLSASYSRQTSGDLIARSFGVRRLTPLECERLQGFPDRHTAWGIDADGERIEISDTQRYKQLGNAVCVNVAEWIGRRIVEVDREQSS